MNSTLSHAAAAPQPLLSTTARIAAGLAVLGFVCAAWMTAERASHEAVQMSTAALSRTYVTLPAVYIVARREGAAMASIAASGIEIPGAIRPGM